MLTADQFVRTLVSSTNALSIASQSRATVEAQMAQCFQNGNGACRLNEATALLVVGALPGIMKPGNEGFIPTAVVTRMGVQPRKARMYNTHGVARWFKQAAKNTRKLRPEGYQATWAPAATHSYARLPIGGALGPVRGETPDIAFAENTYQWRDLTDVEIGGVILRVDREGVLTAFQRVDTNLWVQFVETRPQDLPNLYPLAQGVRFEPSGERPLVVDPTAIDRFGL